jgi:hypothetical protein
MSDTWVSLLSALVGALVGGAASLAGTVLVNRMQMATAARMRMYDEMLPKLSEAISGPNQLDRDAVTKILEQLLRVGAIAGRSERKSTRKLLSSFAEYQVLNDRWSNTPAPLPFELDSNKHIGSTLKGDAWEKLGRESEHMYYRLLMEIEELSESLRTKLH